MSGDRNSSTLLERQEELIALRRGIEVAARGAGSVLVIEGPAGIGKSRLLEAACGLVPDATVLQARGSEFDRHSPYLVAAQLFGAAIAAAVGEEREQLFAGQARLAAPLLDGTQGAPGDGDAVLRGLFWLTVNLAARQGKGAHGPLLLVVDDAHWADRASLRFVQHLATRVDGLPVAILLGIRTGDEQQVVDLLDAVRGTPHAQVLRPAPLSNIAVTAVVEQDLAGAAPAFVHACARVTGGNPFLVHELVHALCADQVPPSDDSVTAVEHLVPASVARSVLVRLGRLPLPAQQLAIAVAIFGGQAPSARAALLADLPLMVAERAADTLSAAHVLNPGEPLTFSHPLIGSAVYADVRPFARTRAHRTAAALLTAEAASCQTIAAHLLLTRPEGKAATVHTLRLAADQARTQGEPRAAVRMLRRAQAELPTGLHRFDLLLELAQAEALAGEHTARRQVNEALTLAVDPASTARALAVLARTCYAEGDHAGTLQATEAALDQLDPDDPAAGPLLAGYLAAGTFHAPSRARTQPRMASLVESAHAGRLPAHPALLAHLALQFALSGAPAGRIRDLADRSLAADPLIDPATHGMPLSLVVQALCCVDEIGAAEAAADRAITAARQHGSVLAYALVSYHRAIPRYHRGALLDALADIDQMHMVREEGWVGADGWTAALSARLHLERDDRTAARRSIDLAAGVSPDSIDYPVALYGKAELALADDQPAAALAAASTSGQLLAQDFGIDHPGLFPWRCTAALAAHQLGDNHRAGRLAHQAIDQARSLGVPRPLAHALRTIAHLNPGPKGLARLTEALEVLEGTPALLEHTAVLVDLGTAQRQVGDKPGALKTLRRGYGQADSLQLTALTTRARQQLHALGSRPRRAALDGAGSLTPTERRVADLASSGLTNSEVAQALFVTPKTVETHLANAYRKLAIASRRELPAALNNPTS